ncbi:MAG: FecR family protein [Odoribacter splanchnicus]
MKNLEKDINRLITDYLSNDLADEERNVLKESLKEETNRKAFREKVQVYWALQSAPFLEQLDDAVAWSNTLKRLRRRNHYLKMALGYAALVVVILGSVLFFRYRSTTDDYREIFEGVTLTLGDGQKVALDAMERHLCNIDSTLHIELKEEGKLVYTVLEGKDSNRMDEEKIRYNTLTVPRGCNFLLQLSDGSQVWLNAESTLKYPERFEATSREVELMGEGYFEVVKDSTAPFSVLTKESRITVLGTSFNLKSYSDEQEVVTTLVTGRIKQCYESGDTVVLTPNVQAVYSKKSCSVLTQQINTAEALGWKNGRFIMKNRPLCEIFKELSRWYNVEVEFESPELEEVCYYLNTDRYEHIQTVLDKLEKTNSLRFELNENKILIRK